MPGKQGFPDSAFDLTVEKSSIRTLNRAVPETVVLVPLVDVVVKSNTLQ